MFNSVCAVLVGLPLSSFCLVGFLRATRTHNTPAQWFLGVLMVAGAAMVVGGISRVRSELALRRRQRQHPRAPWMWREDWASGRVSPSDWTPGTWWSRAIGLGAAALVLVGSLAVLFREVSNVNEAGSGWVVQGLIFTVAAFILFLYVVRLIRRASLFPAPVFEIETLPAWVGGTLGGVVHTSGRLDGATDLSLRLRCTALLVSGSRHGVRRDHWTSEQKVATERVRPGSLGDEISVRFEIPADALRVASEHSVVGNSFEWTLVATASLTGSSYRSVFDVPVFEREAVERPVSAP